MSDIRKCNSLYSNTIQEMKTTISSTKGESKYATKRFNLDFIDGLTEEGVKDLKERAKHNSEILADAKLAKKSIQDKLPALACL